MDEKCIPIQIMCADCGSTNVSRDAWASWHEVRQAWVLGAVFDDGHCHRCERAVSLVEEPLALHAVHSVAT